MTIRKITLHFVMMLGLLSGTATHAFAQGGSPTIPLRVSSSNSGFNRLVVSVTVCAPGTTRCATIPNIMLDTGSTGLRLQGSALPSSLGFPRLTDSHGQSVAECERFVSSNAWGSLRRIDLHLGEWVAKDLPVQVVDAADPSRPESCPASGGPPTSNGTLGIGFHLSECSGECMNSSRSPRFYQCSGAVCNPVDGSVPEEDRLPNPITRFGDGTLNGYILDLPLPSADGAREVPGTIQLGVGTAANNALPGADVFPLPPGGYFSAKYRDGVYPRSYIDSGTPTYVLPDNSYPACSHPAWAICVRREQQDNATMQDGRGQAHPISFLVGDYEKQRDNDRGASRNAASSAKTGATGMVFGAPFFLGKRTALVLENAKIPEHPDLTGPIYAWQASTLR